MAPGSETSEQLVVLRALADPIQQDADGKWLCRICDRRFPVKNSVAVHELVHRRAVGLAPPMVRGERRKAPAYITCGYEGCTRRLNRTSLPSHMRSQAHGLSQADASFYARQRLDEEVRKGAVVPLVEAPAEPEPESPLTDITAIEAVTGILRAARKDGLMPTRLLPSAFALTEHVEEILHELRRLT